MLLSHVPVEREGEALSAFRSPRSDAPASRILLLLLLPTTNTPLHNIHTLNTASHDICALNTASRDMRALNTVSHISEHCMHTLLLISFPYHRFTSTPSFRAVVVTIEAQLMQGHFTDGDFGVRAWKQSGVKSCNFYVFRHLQDGGV